jgi:hypothetical protein
MARLTAKSRKKLPKASFAVPGKRKYPIHDRSHAANALARVSQHGSSAEKAQVRKAVARRYGMGPAAKAALTRKRTTAKRTPATRGRRRR